MSTALCELLGIRYPIIQGAMAWVSESRLVAAVCNAGATGVIASGGRTTDWIRSEIRKTKMLTDKPFGVNLMLMANNCDEVLEIMIEEKVAFATLGAGNPVPYFERIHEAGMKAIPVIPNLKLAMRVEKAGADAIVIEGMEAGGHIGTLTTMALMTNVIPSVSLPVVVAGGIATGRGIATALLMGAAGVQIGSRFLVTEECALHAKAKQRIIDATDTDSTVTGFSRGHGVRGLVNEFTRKYQDLENQGVDQYILDDLATGTSRLAAVDGEIDKGLVQVGQSLCALNKIQSVQEVVDELITQANQSFEQAPSLKL